ncbi:hypothetical protein GQ42DRAFT_41671 [Ramicandelaber brevisporus]|nr:hypothetical protein GQ42DRAFT_41671 [Ramicandelaber brevisporus]
MTLTPPKEWSSVCFDDPFYVTPGGHQTRIPKHEMAGFGSSGKVSPGSPYQYAQCLNSPWPCSDPHCPHCSTRHRHTHQHHRHSHHDHGHHWHNHWHHRQHHHHHSHHDHGDHSSEIKHYRLKSLRLYTALPHDLRTTVTSGNFSAGGKWRVFARGVGADDIIHETFPHSSWQINERYTSTSTHVIPINILAMTNEPEYGYNLRLLGGTLELYQCHHHQYHHHHHHREHRDGSNGHEYIYEILLAVRIKRFYVKSKYKTRLEDHPSVKTMLGKIGLRLRFDGETNNLYFHVVVGLPRHIDPSKTLIDFRQGVAQVYLKE